MRMVPRLAVALVFVCGAIVTPAVAQKKEAPPPKPPSNARPSGGKPVGGAGKQFNPAKELDEFAKMSPEAREKELAKLPPGRQKALLQRFERYQQMTPEQQQRFKENLEIMHSLSPQRQNAVRDKILAVRALAPKDRLNALQGDGLKGYSPAERKLILNQFPGVQKKLERQELPEP